MESITEKLEVFHFLRKLDHFNLLNKDALWPLVNLTSMRHYSSGEILFREEEDPPGLFVVKNGTIEIFTSLQDGTDVIINKVGRGKIIGEISAIDRLKTTASARALDEVDCIFISEFDFTAQLHTYPEFGLQILTALYSYRARGE